MDQGFNLKIEGEGSEKLKPGKIILPTFLFIKYGIWLLVQTGLSIKMINNIPLSRWLGQ